MGKSTSWSYRSYDVDGDGDYCAQTDFHRDGTVHRYEGTNGSFDNGHGHLIYGSTDSFIKREPERGRKADDPESSGKRWVDRW